MSWVLLFMLGVLIAFGGYVTVLQERRIRELQERNDRLTESVFRKAGEPLYMPQPQKSVISASPERSEGWWDVKEPIAPRAPKRRES